ncbi:MAG TPA: VIT1/CCC1 transporter family protein [Candidatus Nanoarchaeia archaeon]|nr:VIT1/CCC1 transporter family protein [Candidatus Nanoarchaeia archaeon]
MKISIRKGLGFGLTSGVITTLGLIVGLSAGTNSKKIVLGGIVLIAIADSLSDALGIHISEESGSKQTTEKEVWESTLSTVFFKFLFALTFAIPVLFFALQTAVIIGVIWGLFLLVVFSFYIAKNRKEKPIHVILEHLIIATLVVIATYFIGNWIATWAV